MLRQFTKVHFGESSPTFQLVRKIVWHLLPLLHCSVSGEGIVALGICVSVRQAAVPSRGRMHIAVCRAATACTSHYSPQRRSRAVSSAL